MQRMKCRAPLLLATMLLALAGCNGGGVRTADEYYAAAQEYQAAGDLRAAVIELKNALQQDAEHASARRMLGELHLAGGDYASAEKELRRARELGIARRQVAVSLARAQAAQGLSSEARDTLGEPSSYDGDRRIEALRLLGDLERRAGEEMLGCGHYREALALAPERWASRIGVADCERVSGELEAAEARLKGFDRANGGDPAAGVLLARVRIDKGERAAAGEVVDRVLERWPGYPEATLMRATLVLERGDLEATEQALQAAPANHPRTHLLRGIAHFRAQRYDQATQSLREAQRAAPGVPATHFWLGLSHLARGAMEQARHHFARARELNPQFTEARALLLAMDAQLGGSDDGRAELQLLTASANDNPATVMLLGGAAASMGDTSLQRSILESGLRRNPGDPALHTALGVALLEQGDYDAALDALEEAATLDSADLDRHVALVRALVGRGRQERALEVARGFVAANPGVIDGRLLLGATALAAGRIGEAREAFEAALARDDRSTGAHYGLAVASLVAGDEQAVIERVERVLAIEPDNVPALLMRYALARRGGEREVALTWLARAAEAAPNSSLVAGAYAEQLLRRGQGEAALEVVGPALETNPEHGHLLRLQALAHMSAGRPGAAVPVFEKLLAADPHVPENHTNLAVAHFRAGEGGRAREVLESAWERHPGALIVVRELVRLEMAAGNRDAAMEAAARMRESDPAAAELLAAEVLAGSGEREQAIQRLRETASDDARISLTLARMHWSAGDQDEAVAVLRERLESHPDDEAAQAVLADFHIARGRHREAVATLAALVERAPENAKALNNLAMLTGEKAPERAVGLARRAFAADPSDPRIADTLGWLLLSEGATEEALPLLRSAATRMPDARTVQYHYAAALASAGEDAAARERLERVLVDEQEFVDRADAEALLVRLQRTQAQE
ncbi:XrtA/PEP-CTERM system TPR-repeat protein PrsT [Arhodomonas sp. SL1]|uniref:XrtA/PEP-CTERM system TPR-repeat protein PrsT n=1 Tax=Arhodomonas sp. SL1 TaxID=3425691 RepID=UPI003F880867